MKKTVKRFVTPALQFLHRSYFKKTRNFSYKGLQLKIEPGVFPPHYLLSTKILLDFLNTLPLKDSTFLDVGCGSGAIGIAAAKSGAIVTAIDISPLAIKNSKSNAALNNVSIEFIQSDLFEKVNINSFDFALINPPFYPKNPKNDEEYAWYCGENFDYFQKLFNQLSMGKVTFKEAYMILSEDCNIVQISDLAKENSIELIKVQTIKKRWEENYIFRLTKN